MKITANKREAYFVILDAREEFNSQFKKLKLLGKEINSILKYMCENHWDFSQDMLVAIRDAVAVFVYANSTTVREIFPVPTYASVANLLNDGECGIDACENCLSKTEIKEMTNYIYSIKHRVESLDRVVEIANTTIGGMYELLGNDLYRVLKETVTGGVLEQDQNRSIHCTTHDTLRRKDN